MATKKKKPAAKAKASTPIANSDRCVPVRFTEAQYARIVKEARSVGRTVTAEVREAVLSFLGIERTEVKPGRRAA